MQSEAYNFFLYFFFLHPWMFYMTFQYPSLDFFLFFKWQWIEQKHAACTRQMRKRPWTIGGGGLDIDTRKKKICAKGLGLFFLLRNSVNRHRRRGWGSTLLRFVTERTLWTALIATWRRKQKKSWNEEELYPGKNISTLSQKECACVCV